MVSPIHEPVKRLSPGPRHDAKNLPHRPVRSESLRTQVVDLLMQAIFDGELRPGQWLREVWLAKSFAVSQTTVREALVHLEQLGLVTRMPQRRTIVTNLSKQEVRDRLRVRVELERMAAVDAAPKLTADDFAELERLSLAVQSANAEGRPFAASQRDLEFHQYIWEKSGNRVLAATLRQICLPLFAFIGLLRSVGAVDVSRTVRHGHEPVIAGLRQGSAAPIEEAIREHIDGSYSRFLSGGANDLEELMEEGEKGGWNGLA